MNSNKKTLTAILILLVMCTGISISYAFFKVASSNNNANTNVTINGAALCMSLQLSSDNITISNEYAVPISDSKALSSDTYKTSVTITNNCNTSQSFNLLLVPNSSNTMPIKALKYALVEEGVTPTSGTLISNEYILDSTIQKQLLAIKNETLKNGFSVGSGTVSSGTKTYNLYLWIDKDEGSLGNGSTMNKSLNAYLTLGSGSVIGDLKLDLYHTIENRYNQDKTYLGLYNGEGADTYANPVYYYKGNVQNNNVLFAGFCWKIVRTTETGGVKIVYNGVQKDFYESTLLLNESEYVNLTNDANYPYTFDSTNKTWTSTNTGTNSSTVTFIAPSNGNYVLNYDLDMSSSLDYIYVEIFNDNVSQGKFTGVTYGQIIFSNLDTTNTIKIVFTRKKSYTYGSRNNVIFSFGKAIGDPVKSCNNTGTDSQIGTSTFNNDYNSPAYVGYMYNTVYPTSSKSMSSQSNIVFGNSFNYNSNNGTYTLKDTKTVATWSSGYNTINNNHYTCMTTGTTCSSIYYVFYTNSSTAYYITLTNGKTVNDALNEMLYADDVNKNDSTIKAYIDNWYENNLIDYEDKLEKDTVFCNDRGIYSLNGWNPDGGSISNDLKFKNYGASNQSLVCANETDRFSMSNAKARLRHPIGLLSVPELSLAGYGISHYFNNGQLVWLGSPGDFYGSGGYAFGWMGGGNGLGIGGVYESGVVRPSVSLKQNTYFSSGDGSFTNPFVIGDAVEEPSGNSFDTVFAANNTDIFSENGLRYEGADPNNYICLDNKTSGACSSSSLLFRIIGLFDEEYSSNGTTSAGTKKLLKVIDTNNYGGTSGKFWSGSSSNQSNNWSKSTLKTELNGTYLSTLLATSGVNSKLSSAIANAKWHLGGANDTSSSNYYRDTITTENFYKAERSPYAASGTLQNLYSGNPEYVFAKVGLMYPSDYGYATVGGATKNKSSCRAKELLNWKDESYSDCKNNDWVYKSQSINWGSIETEWLISPLASSSYHASFLTVTGCVYTSYLVNNNQFAVRPTFYLDSSILKIVGGLGTKDNAYRIG